MSDPFATIPFLAILLVAWIVFGVGFFLLVKGGTDREWDVYADPEQPEDWWK
jgi:hypothetical protein